MQKLTKNSHENCALCGENTPLVQSHIMPKSMYKKTASACEANSTDLVVQDFGKNIAFSTSRQHKEFLLCRCCESKVSVRGENYVAKHCYQGGKQFPLRDRLIQFEPKITKKDREIWHDNDVMQCIDTEKIKYFVLSVIWRHSICKTAPPSGVNHYRGALGKKYEEEIRRFLNGEVNLPDKIFFLVYVDFDPEPLPLLMSPTVEKKKFLGHNVCLHSFIFPGLRVRINVGGKTQLFQEKLGADLVFVKWGMSGTKYLGNIIKQTGKLIPKGKFAEEWGELDF